MLPKIYLILGRIKYRTVNFLADINPGVGIKVKGNLMANTNTELNYRYGTVARGCCTCRTCIVDCCIVVSVFCLYYLELNFQGT